MGLDMDGTGGVNPVCIAILELPASCVLPSGDPDIPSQTCNERDQAPVQDCPQVQLGNGPTADPELLLRPGVSSWENNSTSFLFTAPHHQKGPLGVSQREESLGGRVISWILFIWFHILYFLKGKQPL